MTALSTAERVEMRRVERAATSGPWEAVGPHVLPTFGPRERDGIHTGIAHLYDGEYIENMNGEEDAAFIAMARTAIPRLLDALDAMERERDEARTFVMPIAEAVAKEREACAAICESEARRCAAKASQFGENSENQNRWDARDGILVKAAKAIRAAADREDGR